MAVIWEIVQGVGSVVGLLTGFYVLYDYLTRETPTAFLVSRTLIVGGAQKKLALRVTNKSDRPIICRWKNGANENDPYAMSIMVDYSVRATVESVLPGESAVVIDGKEAVEFPIIPPSGRDQFHQDAPLTTEIRWGFAQRRFLQIDRKIKVSITAGAATLLLGEED